jgi:two-component system cell cycle response regulator DivK
MAAILVVEDNQLNLELVTDLLTAAGHEVRSARTAEDGIRDAIGNPPDLVLMDIRLPGMDGRTAAAMLKRLPATNQIPVIALTAQAMKGDEAAVLAAGFDGYLAKPINTRTFVATIARLLQD